MFISALNLIDVELEQSVCVSLGKICFLSNNWDFELLYIDLALNLCSKFLF